MTRVGLQRHKKSVFITLLDVISLIAMMQYFLGPSRHRRLLTKATEQLKHFSFVYYKTAYCLL
jgi:hypothetical protein